MRAVVLAYERGLLMRDPLDRARAYVRWTLRRGPVIWLLALIVAVPAFAQAASLYLHLRSDVEALLPTSAPSVVAIDELRARMPGLQYLGVVVDSGTEANMDAAEKMLDALAERIRTYPPNLVREVRTSDADERRFVQDHSVLYMDVEDLATIRRRIEARRDYEVAKEEGAALDDDAPPPSVDVKDIEEKYRARASNRFDDDRYSNRALHLSLLLVRAGGFETGRARGEELLSRVRHDLASLGGPAHFAPGMRVGFAGDVAISVEETSALVADLSLSSVIVLVLVVGVVLVYYRWWPSIFVLAPPLLLATIYAFAVASLPPLSVTELNSNTAFLGSIIVGNGINFGIFFLARYVEERRHGRSVEDALAVSVWGASLGTLSAALAAGVSYGSLALTDFRGFRQFGFIGGVGMAFSWLAAFLLMPPLVAWMDRRVPANVRPHAAPYAPVAWLSRAVLAHPRAIAVASLLLTGAALLEDVTFRPSEQLETDFSHLRRADTWVSGEGYWGRRMEALLGTYLTPTVILTDDLAQSRAIAAALRTARASPPLSEQVASVRTIDDVVPPDQPAKLHEVDALRDDLTPRLRSLIPEAQRDGIDRLLESGQRGPIVAADLPPGLTSGLRERDGTIGREVLVFPRPSKLLWQGGPLGEFVQTLRGLAQHPSPEGARPARVAGSLPLSADILASVRRDGPRASLVALLGVMAVVFHVLRRAAARALVIGSLLMAVTWLLAATMVLGVRINFANFIAYPITFGIGVDYAVNVVSRDIQTERRDVGAALRGTGGAVALCSMTTIIGYSSLLMAQNRGLFLFGVLAVLGEVCCLSTAIVVVPAWLRWLEVRGAKT